MKSTGIVRGIDSLGRIVLPKELRTSMHLDTDTKLEIFVDGDAIVLKKHRPAGSCDFAARWTSRPSSSADTASVPPAAASSAHCNSEGRPFP